MRGQPLTSHSTRVRFRNYLHTHLQTRFIAVMAESTGPHREAAATAAERRAASQHHRTPAAVTAPARDCPPAARGSHFREAAATVAERRAASQPPSPHHRQTAMESSNADASAAQYAPKPPTTRPPSRLQLNTGPKQPNPPPTPKARSQHHRTPAAVTAPACDWAEGWGDFGLEHLSEPERKRKRAQENDGGAKRRKS